MDLSEIESAIEEYYKIKGKYEKKVKDARKRIIGSDLSKRKKRVKLNNASIVVKMEGHSFQIKIAF